MLYFGGFSYLLLGLSVRLCMAVGYLLYFAATPWCGRNGTKVLYLIFGLLSDMKCCNGVTLLYTCVQ